MQVGKSDQAANQVRIGPASFVTGPYVPCPKCAKISFGVLYVNPSSYSRRCKSCLYPIGTHDRQDFQLPALQKKIIYLDQFAISDMMKSINPRSKAYREKRVPSEFRELFERLDVLYKLQLIICPESSFHHYESCVSQNFVELKRMYEHLSGEVSG